MPLPAPGTPWPPDPAHAADLARWAAWWSGRPEDLTAAHTGTPTTRRIRPSQYDGGIVGAAARGLWGTPPPGSEPETRVHVPLPGSIASASSGLLFAEAPTITVTDLADPMLDDLHHGDHLRLTLARAAETCAAVGGVALRVVWDDTLPVRRALIDPAPGTHVWPTIRWGYTVAVTIVTRLQDLSGQPGTVWRHVECHETERGEAVIRHGLYEGSVTDMGERRPYDSHPALAWLLAQPRLVEDTIHTGQPHLTATYVANRPVRGMTAAGLTAVGVPDIDGVEGLLAGLDEVATGLIRDVRLGRARLVVPEWMLTMGGPGSPARFDADREIFTVVGGSPIEGSHGTAADITAWQPDVRAEDHLRTWAALTKQIVSDAGYSPATFGLDEEGAPATATEVSTLYRSTLRTRLAKSRSWTVALQSVLNARAAVDQVLGWGPGITDQAQIGVVWPAADQDPPQVRATTAELMARSMAASTQTLVQVLHPDWDPDQVEKEVSRIREEQDTVPDLGDPAVGESPAAAVLAAAGTAGLT